MSRRRAVLLAVLAVNLVACSGGGAGATRAPTALTIYGASSLKAVLSSAAAAYEIAVPGTILTISTDASSALETQIEQGAPADLFLSADATNPQKLVDRGLASGAAVPFARNHLAIIVPAANPARITTPSDLVRPGVRLIAAGDAVPITNYATRLVGNLAAASGDPAGFVAAYRANIVSKEDNVGAIVARIALGEGDAGIVYRTDAIAAAHVTTIEIPAAVDVAATYAGVVVKASKSPAAATAFLDWLTGPDGTAILAAYGFVGP